MASSPHRPPSSITTGWACAVVRPRGCAVLARRRRAASASSRPGYRRGRRPDARHRRGGRGRRLRRARGSTCRRAFHRRLEERGRSTSANPAYLVVVDPIDGSLNAKRGLAPPRALDRRRRRSDDGGRALRLRLRLRCPARNGAPPAAWAPTQRPPLEPAARAPHARRPAGARRGRVGRPALAGGLLRALVDGHPPNPRASGRSRSRCVRSPPRASTAMARCALPRPSTPPPRSHRPRVRRPRRVRRRGRWAAGAPLDLVPHSPVVAARTPEALRAAGAAAGGDLTRQVDWQLAGRIAAGRRGGPAAAAPPPPAGLALDRRGRRASRSSRHRASCPSAALPPAEWVDRGGVDRREPRATIAIDAGPALEAGGAGGPPGPRRAAARGGASWRPRSAACWALRPSRARPVRARRSTRPGRPRRGCCSWARTSRGRSEMEATSRSSSTGYGARGHPRGAVLARCRGFGRVGRLVARGAGRRGASRWTRPR